MQRNLTISMACLLGIAALLVGTTAFAEDKAPCGASLEPPAIVAVWFKADYCVRCQKLETNYAKLLKSTKDLDVLFVSADLTNEVTRKQSAMLMGALGLQKLVAETSPTVGQIILVDTRSKRIIQKISVAGEVETIQTAISTATQSIKARA